MDRIRNISVLAAAMIVLTIVVRSVASMFLPAVSPLFWVVPAYFMLFYVAVILLLRNMDRLADNFMLLKGVKVFVTLVLIFALAFFFRQHAKEIIIYFLVYYMLLLVAESVFLLYKKKRR